MSTIASNESRSASDLSSLSDWARLPAVYENPERAPSLVEAQEYCRRLARSHYENFSVATWFLPRSLRQDFFNIYAYCRISDDLGDETGDPQASLRLLDEWEAELNACYAGQPRHPVFVALAETVRTLDIPRQPFADLLKAFRQDQQVTRYPRFEDLLGYCRYSANPVGHLVLYVCGYRDAGRQALSDFTCTALQLANFWQDVTVDLLKDRVYIPIEAMERHGYTLGELFARRFTPAFGQVMREMVSKARELFLIGLPLSGMVDRRLGVDLDLFSRGGMRVLEKIEEQGYDVLSSRPAISRLERVRLLVGSLARMAFRARAA